MKFEDFRDQLKHLPLFSSQQFMHLTREVNTLRNQILHWSKKGKVITLRKGLYTLCDDDRTTGLSRYFLANQLYQPSYISLESALSFYGIIPEAVYQLTSVSSLKTQSFNNHFGQFIYHHIKPDLYGNFMSQKDEFEQTFFIASLERAIIDFLYFRVKSTQHYDEDIFTESFRWQNLDDVNLDLLVKISAIFKQKKLDHLITLLTRHIRNEYD